MNICITDCGCGFSKEALEHAKERFYMANQSRSSKLHYGMGLYIVDSIIKQHKGKLLLDNSIETKGAKVTIQLPLWKNGFICRSFLYLYEIFKIKGYPLNEDKDCKLAL